MGNLRIQIPLTSTCMIVANLALCGFPFFAGFYSKDLIIEFCLFSPTNTLIIVIFLVATALTAAYSVRFILTTA